MSTLRFLQPARSGIAGLGIRTAPRGLASFHQSRQPSKDIDPESLGGPGGQQPPPPKPGGPEAVQRNWIPLAGAALVLAAGYAYFTAPKSAVEAAKRKGKQAASDASDQTKDLAEKVKRDAKEQGSKTAKELSGKGGHGPFRAE